MTLTKVQIAEAIADGTRFPKRKTLETLEYMAVITGFPNHVI